MLSIFAQAEILGIQKYSRNSNKTFEYGTAGFRDKSMELPHVMYRMGLLAALRSKALNGQVVGLMITASHNPEEDNGLKLCEPLGEMLNEDWEVLAKQLVNAKNEELAKTLEHILTTNSIKYDEAAYVYVGKDTRSSSSSLANAAIDGVTILQGKVKDFGLLTTPQLHYVVCCHNKESYGHPSVEGYYKKLSTAFENLKTYQKVNLCVNYKNDVYLDGANGVGGYKMKEILEYLKSVTVHVFNYGSVGILNYKCGADFVKIEQKPPEGFQIMNNKRYASFDGDGDRLVYFYMDENSVFHLLDGDKIATLIAKYLKELVEKSDLKLQIKVIQTAYANGSSTDYIQNVLRVPVMCVPTGIKHLHHEAKQCDIGVYFEANGHGTVVFSEKTKAMVKELTISSNCSDVQKVMARKFLSTIDLINETVGDAISDLLLVEAILFDQDMDITLWNSFYKDYPSKQLKVKVPDRKAITTTDAERICVEPAGLQKAINSTVAQYKNARAFVRPSGTEDVVRVYAEADTQDNAVALGEEICLLVKKFTSENY